MKRHFEQIDIIKGIGIILVVILHIGIPSIFITDFFASFQISIFLVSSGFCFNFCALDEKPYKYIGKRIKKLWAPYFILNSIFLICSNFFILLNIYTDNDEFVRASSIGIANWYGLTHYKTIREIIYGICDFLVFGINSGETQLGGGYMVS